VWPIGVGHPWFGCSEKGVGFEKPMFSLSDVKTHTPPNAFPNIDHRPLGGNMSAAGVAVASAAVGAVIGASVVASSKIKKQEKAQKQPKSS